MRERRRSERVKANLRARWAGVLTRSEGTVVDLSVTGCFVLTADHVKKKESIKLEVQLPTGRWMSLLCEVVYQIHDMGFALHFTSPNEIERRMLAEVIKYVRSKEADKAAQSKPERRHSSRLNIPVEVILEAFDDWGQVAVRERTVTENISPRGAAVLTTLSIEAGNVVRVTSAHQHLSVKAVVRARRVGKDGIPRLHLEFVDRQWPLQGVKY